MKKINLANTPGCYAYELQKELGMIEYMTESDNYSVTELKSFVHRLVSKAHVTNAQKNFIKNLAIKTYKRDILYYCKNVVNKASRYCR